jgi:hypothetical protein
MPCPVYVEYEKVGVFHVQIPDQDVLQQGNMQQR